MPELTPRQQILARIKWRAWQIQVIQWARMGGWRVYAINDSRTQHWDTDTGFPDVLMLRGGRQIVAECKCGSGRERPDQVAWREAFALVPGVEPCVWRPENGDAIRDLLLGDAPMHNVVSRASMDGLVTQSMRPPTRNRRGPPSARRGPFPRAAKPRLPESVKSGAL